MQTLLIATTNKAKFKEIQEILSDLPIFFVSLTDVGITQNVEEDGATYQENAEKKAKFYAKASDLPAISDDGGFEIAALNGAPGVKSKRWLGHEASDEEIIEHMRNVSKELPENNRNAKLRTVVSFALPNGRVWSATAEETGIVSKKEYHSPIPGYPYRLFFYNPRLRKYYPELTKEELQQYNHRYKAINMLKSKIKKALHI